MARLFKKGRFSILHVGLDESNLNTYRGEEIIVAVFSYDPSDSKDQMITNSKSYRSHISLDRLLCHANRSYLFALWKNGKELNPKPSHLVRATPFLVSEYLERNLSPHREIESLVLHIDGRLDSTSKFFLEEKLRDSLHIPFEIYEYPKGKREMIIYPRIVQIADVLSNDLYRISRGRKKCELAKLPQFVSYFS